QPRMTMDEARAKAQPCAELSGAHQIALPGGAKARVEVGEFVFQVGAVNAGKPMPVGLLVGLEVAVLMYFALSFFTVGGFIAALAFFVPPMGLLDDEGIDKDQLFLMQQYLKAAAEREEEEKATERSEERRVG